MDCRVWYCPFNLRLHQHQNNDLVHLLAKLQVQEGLQQCVDSPTYDLQACKLLLATLLYCICQAKLLGAVYVEFDDTFLWRAEGESHWISTAKAEKLLQKEA